MYHILLTHKYLILLPNAFTRLMLQYLIFLLIKHSIDIKKVEIRVALSHRGWV